MIHLFINLFLQEHCRKYSKAQESFLPWLSSAEDRLAKLPATAFTKKEVEKQLRELQQIRNDIWKRYAFSYLAFTGGPMPWQPILGCGFSQMRSFVWLFSLEFIFFVYFSLWPYVLPYVFTRMPQKSRKSQHTERQT